MDIKDIINNIYPLNNNAFELLLNNFIEVSLPKGHLLFKSNRVEKNIYFIKKGTVRAFYYLKENEITFWFGQEGDPVLSMQSYIKSSPGYESIELIEDCELYKINSDVLQKLYLNDIDTANWGRKLAEKELLRTEENFISRQFKTALERYEDLLNKNPYLLQKVQLGYIASYLGITQVTLSRIRTEIGSGKYNL